MPDFEFLQNPVSGKWVIFSPRRAKRPDIAHGIEPICPFCPGKESEEQELYRLDSVRVIPNKFPFAPIHEVIIHSPDHHKNFGELSLPHAENLLQVYRQRYKTHEKDGQVYIFHNRQKGGGESLPHPHTQLTVIPQDVTLDIPRLATPSEMNVVAENQKVHATSRFVIFCPKTSQWPDEVWIAPKERGRAFGDIRDEEVKDLSFILTRLVQIFDLRHGLEFPFNFYIYPGGDWYLRIIPRVKVLGGFEVGTGIFVNTQDPQETIEFIKEHFDKPVGGPNEEKIKTTHTASYRKRV